MSACVNRQVLAQLVAGMAAEGPIEDEQLLLTILSNRGRPKL